jgi:hypothetical protein
MPPGFADRPRVKAPAAPAVPRAPVTSAPPRAPIPTAGTVADPSKGASPLSSVFDDVVPAAAAAPPQAARPAWPTVPAVEACKTAGLAVLRDKKVPAGTPPDVAAAAKKVAGVLSLAERTAMEKAGPESHFADALAARIAVELARAEAGRLLSRQAAAFIDDAAVKAVTQINDAASARLQKEVEVVIGRGDVETLQLLTIVNAALSRDLLLFKEAADRLRGLASAPRMGAGSLDPDVVLPDQVVRPTAKPTARPVVKPELREFQGLGEGSPQSRRRGVLFVSVLAMAGAIVNVLFFAYPRVQGLPSDIPGIARIEISAKVARITVAPNFAEQQARAVPTLTQALRARGVDQAMLVRQNGSPVGQISVRDGKTYGFAAPAKLGDIPLPPVPTQRPVPTAPPAPAVPPTQSASTQPRND